MKVAQRLAATGFIKSTRGRNGGLMLALPPAEINLGKVVRALEDVGGFVECFDAATNMCVATPACGLKHILSGGVQAMLSHYDQYTLVNLVPNAQAYRKAVGLK